MNAIPHYSRDARLPVYVFLGVLAGTLFVAFDVLSEQRIGSGTLTGPLAHAHTLIDRVVPILVGGLLGVCAHYVSLRTRLLAAEEAAARAESLRLRLQKVERDQAVWVLAAAVLHEVNNPLHALGLLLDELGGGGNDRATREDLVERARRQARRALKHLDTLRTLRRTTDPECEEIALDRIIGTLTEDVNPLANERGVVVRIECPRAIRARADPSYVRTIVENLVDNSLHSLENAPRGCVTIRLDTASHYAIVRVTDDGPPLDAQTSATLFEPLRSTKTRGLGLGLPIARALARAMRGDLVLEEDDQKTFRLVLPMGGTP